MSFLKLLLTYLLSVPSDIRYVENPKRELYNNYTCQTVKNQNVISLKVDQEFEKDQNVKNEVVDQNVENQNVKSQKCSTKKTFSTF